MNIKFTTILSIGKFLTEEFVIPAALTAAARIIDRAKKKLDSAVVSRSGGSSSLSDLS